MGRLEVDTLRELENTVESLQSRLQIMEDQVKKLTRENSRLSVAVAEMQTMSEEQRELGDEMVERVQDVKGRIAYLENLSMDDGEQEGRDADAVGGTPVGEGVIVASASKSELKTRAFFACIRAVLLGLMGIRKKDMLPEVMRRGFWSSENVMDPKRLLRPRWDDGWPVNRAGWVGEVVQKVKQDGRKWSTSLAQEMLNVLPDDVVEDGLETCFGTLAKRYREARDKSKGAQEETRIQNRRRRRKVMKASERSAVRNKIPSLKGLEHDWMFQWQYQSTDESDSDPVTATALDPDTEDEGHGLNSLGTKGPARTRPWRQRAPAYRPQAVSTHLCIDDGDQVTAKFDEVDVEVFKACNAADTDTNQGNTHRARKRGASRSAQESKLPILRKNAEKKDGVKVELQKIPLAMLDPGWWKSEHGKPYRSVQYIADWVAGETEKELEVEDGGDGDDGAEGQAE
ncbi:hypothetical protein C8Q72DRAFT_898161, partial [Fomitopsis betulina]